MADFKLFEPILLRNEGGWCNKAKDSGGETWEGISRKNYPKWSGWQIVDRIKAEQNFPDHWSRQQVRDLDLALHGDAQLSALVDAFYKCEVWDIYQADNIQNQSIANFLVDWGVNAGASVPIKHAQLILGVAVDGKCGPNTIAAINEAPGNALFLRLQEARRQFYQEVVNAHPEDREFLSDWLERNASFKYVAQALPETPALKLTS